MFRVTADLQHGSVPMLIGFPIEEVYAADLGARLIEQPNSYTCNIERRGGYSRQVLQSVVE